MSFLRGCKRTVVSKNYKLVFLLMIMLFFLIIATWSSIGPGDWTDVLTKTLNLSLQSQSLILLGLNGHIPSNLCLHGNFLN